MPRPTNLSLESTDRLLAELFDRYEQVVFHGTIARPLADHPDRACYSMITKGDPCYNIGLAHGLIHYLEQQQDLSRVSVDPSEL